MNVQNSLETCDVMKNTEETIVLLVFDNNRGRKRASATGTFRLPRFNSRTVRELLTRTTVVKCIRTQ